MITSDIHGSIVGPCDAKPEADYTRAIRSPLLGVTRCEPCEKTCHGTQCGRSANRMHTFHFFDRPNGTRGVWTEGQCD